MLAFMHLTPKLDNDTEQTKLDFNEAVQLVRDVLKANQADLQFRMAVRVACPDRSSRE